MDTIEGTVGEEVWYHYDLDNDVLYLRIASQRDTEALGEEATDGVILLRADNNAAVGMTIVNYWRRFGQGAVQDVSLNTLHNLVAARARAWEQARAS